MLGDVELAVDGVPRPHPRRHHRRQPVDSRRPTSPTTPSPRIARSRSASSASRSASASCSAPASAAGSATVRPALRRSSLVGVRCRRCQHDLHVHAAAAREAAAARRRRAPAPPRPPAPAASGRARSTSRSTPSTSAAPASAPLYVQFFLFTFAFSCFTSGFALFARGALRLERARDRLSCSRTPASSAIILQGGLIGRLVKKFGEHQARDRGLHRRRGRYVLLGVREDARAARGRRDDQRRSATACCARC